MVLWLMVLSQKSGTENGQFRVVVLRLAWRGGCDGPTFEKALCVSVSVTIATLCDTWRYMYERVTHAYVPGQDHGKAP